MHDRAKDLIETLDLARHPEGGYFREVFRSPHDVRAGDRRERPALTSIYFLLPQAETSRWHRVASDEIWHYYEGAPLELVTADLHAPEIRRTRLGPVATDQRPVCAVPAGTWQAARPTGAYTLVGCSVGPGFDFEDFSLLSDDVELASRFRATFPDWAGLI